MLSSSSSALPPNVQPQPLQEILDLPPVMPVTYFTFMPHQQRVVKRMAQKCRGQHGMLLIHSMGSGKTISAVGIWLNYPPPSANGRGVNKRLVIMTPPGLDSAFRGDMRDMGIAPQKIATWEATEQLVFVNYDDFVNGRVKSSDGSRMSVEQTIEWIKELLVDAFVIADEAHNIANLLKVWALQQKTALYVGLIDAFESAFKVILLSGTPLQRDWGDLTILASLAAGYRKPTRQRLPVYPTYTTQINKVYPVDWAWTTWLRQKFLNDTTFISTVAGLGAVAVGMWLSPPQVLGLMGLSVIPKVYMKVIDGSSSSSFVPIEGGFMDPVTGLWRATAGEFGVKGALVGSVAGGIGGLANVAAGPIPQFSIEKMGDDIARHVSYFNYEEEDFHRTENFPLAQRSIVPVVMTSFQLDFYIKQSVLKDVLDDMDLEFAGRATVGGTRDAFRLGESVSVLTNDMIHYSRMRVVGNLSEDNYYYTTIRAATPDIFGNRVYYIYPRFQNKPNPNVTDLSRGFAADGVPRTDAVLDQSAYEAVLNEYDASYIQYKLSQYKQRIGAQIENTATAQEISSFIDDLDNQLKEIIVEVTSSSSNTPQSETKKRDLEQRITELERQRAEAYAKLPSETNLFRLHNMQLVHDKRAARITFATNKFFQALDVLCEQRTLYHYLPIFYSNFDEYGFRLFSAFLTQRGYYHLLIDPSDDSATRLKLLDAANLPYRRLQLNPATNHYESVRDDEEIEQRLNLNRYDGDAAREHIVPLCVLLHPSIVEGLSFNLSPSIVVNEAIDGYGRAEQLYARILRAIPVHTPYNFHEQMKNAINEIVAMNESKLEQSFQTELKKYNALSDTERANLDAIAASSESYNNYTATLTQQTTDEKRIFLFKLRYLVASMKPPKTTNECVEEGFYEDRVIPADYPRIVVRENVLFKKGGGTGTNGKYPIQLRDGTTGYVLEQDMCVDRFCRSPVYYELADDFSFAQCKKKVFLLQNTFGTWTLLKGDTLKSIGQRRNIEMLKTAPDIVLPNFMPPILDISSLWVQSAKNDATENAKFQTLLAQVASATTTTTTQKVFQWLAKPWKARETPAYQSFMRYFMDTTYPTGLWDVTDTTRTNALSATATPDEIVETNNRVLMFNWLELMKSLRAKFKDGEAFCDTKCEGKCQHEPDEACTAACNQSYQQCQTKCKHPIDNMCTDACYANNDKCISKCDRNFNRVCDLWVQESFGDANMQMAARGSCFRDDVNGSAIQTRNAGEVAESVKRGFYDPIAKSERAVENWQKYKVALQNLSGVLDQAEQNEQQQPLLDAPATAYFPSWDRQVVEQTAKQALRDAFTNGKDVDIEAIVQNVIGQAIANKPSVTENIAWYAEKLKSLFGGIIFLQSDENKNTILHPM